MTSRIEVEITPQVHAFALRLHPEQRRALKQALRDLAAGRAHLLPLEEELTGLYRLRIGRFRLVCRYVAAGRLRCFYLAERRLVYDVLRANPGLWAGSDTDSP
jgi:mRNA-degrading endonuclease RelE of RelBE toxin-antitoxin system